MLLRNKLVLKGTCTKEYAIMRLAAEKCEETKPANEEDEKERIRGTNAEAKSGERMRVSARGNANVRLCAKASANAKVL